MKNRTVVLELLPLETKPSCHGAGEPFLEVDVSYRKGGTNYFTGGTSPRGYYLSATPVTINKTPYGTSKGFTLLSGRAAFLKEAARFSPKGLAEAVEIAKKHLHYHALKANVLSLNNLTLKTEEPANV